MAKFFKTVFQLTVLSEGEPPGDVDLGDLAYETTEGAWSGRLEVLATEEVSPKEMAALARAQGTDPEFFGLDAEGGPQE